MMEISQMNQKKKINVGRIERIVSMLGGGAAMLFALRRLTRSSAPLAAGGSYLLYRGISGRDPIYKALGITRAGLDGSGGIEVSRTITIAKPRSEVYSYWRNFENLPRFMQHLNSVSLNRNSTGREQSHWVAKAPLGTSIEWDAELFDDQPDRRIAWRSLPGSQVETHGFVEFHDSPDHIGTLVRVNLVYLPPAGSFGAAVAKLFGEEPAWQVQDDLRRLKQLLETGEIPTVVGQSSGRVGAVMKERQSIPPVSQEIKR